MPSMPNWTHHRARLNGLEVRYVEQGHGPVVLLLHGFPHTWFSWRHQIGHLAEAGYHVVAPDLRGMGQTSAPEPVEEYRVDRITGDLCALLDHLGVATAVCSGLDFGMYAAYDLALDHPERVRGHHALSGEVDFTEMWRLPPGTSYRAALPEPPALPWPWLTEWELETYVNDYARSGFGGGIRWYLALDLNWRYRRDRAARRTTVPFYFLGSDRDVDLAHWHGANPVEMLSAYHGDVRGVRIVPGAGHMISMAGSPGAAAPASRSCAITRTTSRFAGCSSGSERTTASWTSWSATPRAFRGRCRVPARVSGSVRCWRS